MQKPFINYIVLLIEMSIIVYTNVSRLRHIWRLLEVTNEATNQVKESKINLLVHSYE